MKRFFIILASVLMMAPAASAQPKNAAKILKDLSKAKENVGKKNDASSWHKLGVAYLNAFEAPIDGLYTGMDQLTLTVMTKGQAKLSSESRVVNQTQLMVDKYADKELYLDQNGGLVAYKITQPIIEEDALAKSFEAFQKAASLGASAKDLAPSMSSLARRFWANAICEYSLGEYASASANFEKCYEVSSSPAVGQVDTNAIVYAGITSVLSKDPNRAIALFEKCRQIPGVANGSVYANLAESYKMLGNNDKCKEVLAEGFEKFPTDQGILVSLINVYLDSGDNPDKIIAVMRKAQENEPKNASLVYAEGNLYRNMKQYDKAIELYHKASDLDPKYVFAPFSEGDTYYQMALDIQEKAENEADDAKYNVMAAQINDCLKKAIEPFEKAFNMTDDVEIKTGCAEYLKAIYFRFREEKPEYQANYDKYHKFVLENAPASK